MPVIPFIPLIAAGVGAAGSIISGSRAGRTSSQQQQESGQFDQQASGSQTGRTTFDNTTTDTNRSTTNFLDQPEYRGLRDLLLGRVTQRLQQPSALGSGYLAQGVGTINQNAGFANQALQNRLSGMGLGRSGANAAGQTGIEMQRFGDLNKLELIDMPRLERDFQNQDLDMAMRLFGMQRPSSTTTSSGTTHATGASDSIRDFLERQSGSSTGTFSGSNVGAGSTAGNALGSVSDLLGMLYGMGVFGGRR